jgi:sulfite reductase (NADPH) hemoprotein beta-component
MAKIVTANRLADGIVVYLGSDGSWVEGINQAKTFEDGSESKQALETARADEGKNLIVDPFLVDVTTDANGLKAVSLRNAIRARGPTIDFLPRSHS